MGAGDDWEMGVTVSPGPENPRIGRRGIEEKRRKKERAKAEGPRKLKEREKVVIVYCDSAMR